MRRIGIYGGSFNPPHLGHVLAARNARALLQLGEILFIPAAIPPHKAVAGGSPDGETRLALTELAIAGEPGMSVSRIELDRPGPSYTVDTLRALRESYGQDELFLLMGTDMFLSFFQWREPEAIAKLATPVCMARVRADAALSAALQQQAKAVETAFGVRPIVLQNECLEISSTEARRLLFFGIADGLLHPDVLAKIEREKLYGVGGDYRGLPFEDLRRVSLSLHKEKRRAHTQGVSDTAVQLAQKYGADTQLAARAGILHDVTKALTPGEQQALIGRWQLPVTDFERANPQLLHAKTGAAAAQSIFGESDAVVSAIKYHTTGKPDMTALEKIIYLADMIEPNRTYPGVDAIREACARVRGAYCLLVYAGGTMVAVRDPHGFHPLALGRLDGAPVLASETCAFDLLEADYERPIQPGEMLIMDGKGEHSEQLRGPLPERPRQCIFELVYFARPDSFVFGEQVYQCRKQMGWQLAHESTPDVDFIMPFPDSGVYSAVGFAQCAELPYEHAMIRNHYVGRTFIQPTQSMRNFGVRVKINPVRSMIEGKKICIVDDSIVRGTTMITRVKKLRELGAKEVHIRISCPPVKFPCFYGIDFASRGELIAAKYSLPEITKMLDVDSLHYLSIDGLLRSVMQSDSYCLACFDGNYPVPCRESGKLRLECGGCCGSR